jgi:hypothetical protein
MAKYVGGGYVDLSAAGASAHWEVKRGYFDVSIYGTFTADISVERSLDGGTNWNTFVTVSDSALEEQYTAGSNSRFRFNVTSFTTGTPYGMIRQ